MELRISTWWRHQMKTFSALLAICVGIHRSPVNSPHNGQWRGALMFSLICVWINAWVNNREAGDLRRYRAHCDVTVINANFGGFVDWSNGELTLKRKCCHFDESFVTDCTGGCTLTISSAIDENLGKLTAIVINEYILCAIHLLTHWDLVTYTSHHE